MPRSKPNHDFEIHVDPSCLSTPMDEEIQSPTNEAPKRTRDTPEANDSSADDGEVDTPISAKSSDRKSDAEMTKDTERKSKLQPSIEEDDDEGVRDTRADSRTSSRRASKRTEELIEKAARDIVDQVEHENSAHDEEGEGHSMLSERSDLSFQPDDREQSYVESHLSDSTPRVGDGDESSSQHGGTDEDVFTDKSPRSSMGSYDAGSESGKGVDADNMTTITRSPRISDISQYEKEDFIPTARGTPRPPFRTPSDVRAMQMSSPTGSVYGSPRSSKKHFPTVSRLGTPSASAQYSPKRKSTPPRFKTRQEAPLVLLHVTLLPLRWVWGDLVNNLDPVEMSEQAKTLRNSWRILQDRVGDTVIERGILLGHPQNDYEVLEERLLEALDLPVRRRARILECGHYLGPANEASLVGDESEDDYDKPPPSQSSTKRHWCATCKSEIRYDSLGADRIFRVKVYASNGLMRAGAWEACWKEMERVDVELEPIVEPAVQDEIVRLAAAQQEREIAQQEEAEIAKEVALQYEEQRRSEELLQQAQAQMRSSPSPSPEPEVVPETVREERRESRASRRRQRDEERLREIYGQSPPPPEPHRREPSPHPESYAHSSPSPPPPPRSPEPERPTEQRQTQRSGYQSASLPELLWQSVRVLMQDRKNVAIVALSFFVLLLSLRSTPPEPSYEPIVHRLKNMPEMQRISAVNPPPVAQEYQRPMEARTVESIAAAENFEAVHSEPSCSRPIYHEASYSQASQSSAPSADYQEADSIMQDSAISAASEPSSQSAQEASTSPTSVSRVYEPCESPVDASLSANAQASSAESDTPVVQEAVEEIETVTEKKVVRVVHTVTETQTQIHTQTETQTQTTAESITAVEAAEPEEATETPQAEDSSVPEDAPTESQDDIALPENTMPVDPVDEAAEDDSAPGSLPEVEVVEPAEEPEEVPLEI
ncbi:hypothetical protein F5Y01DRAFT_273840 [Xylaria sp. FL0043]|nr:hypothetical protein F5Y01DRAFT_273840 [Xylaria sp. FL0043]